MKTVRWSIPISEEVDSVLRAYLTRHGISEDDLARFVEDAVLVRLFELTVEDVKRRNRGVPQDEILEAIDDALAGGSTR